MAGNNATSIFRNFHKSCFNKENYLNHFLAEKELFTLKNLSRILRGVGTKICPTFKKLHDLCFNKAGNKINYLNNLIKNNQPNKIFNILYEKVRKAPSAFLDDISLQQQGVVGIEESEEEDIDDPLIQQQSTKGNDSSSKVEKKTLVKLCRLSPEVHEELKKNRGTTKISHSNITNLEEQGSADLSSYSESQLPGKADDKPETYLNDPSADSQLQRSCQSISS